MGVLRNHGGSAAISNLKALFFRGMRTSYGQREAGCAFCALEGSGRELLENEMALCIADAFPVSEGRNLVIPRRPCGRRAGVAPAGVDRHGGAVEAAAGTAKCTVAT